MTPANGVEPVFVRTAEGPLQVGLPEAQTPTIPLAAVDEASAAAPVTQAVS